MIPIQLQDMLIARFKEEFKHLQLVDGQYLNIFPQHLPAKSKSNETQTHYPCLIIRLSEGEGQNSDDADIATILFIAGVYDKNDNHQGYRDSVSIISRICESLIRNPLIDRKYELNTDDLKWAYNNDDAMPYFFCGVETKWFVPKFMREDVEGMI